MYCTACGTAVPPEANFCAHCGARQSLPERSRGTSASPLLMSVPSERFYGLLESDPRPVVRPQSTWPDALTFMLPGKVLLELQLIQAGSLLMGSLPEEAYADDDERPAHRVILTHDYYIGKYPITQEQWRVVMGNNPSRFKGVHRPVDQVSWYDVQSFLDKLNRLLQSDGLFGLPTEAQWEYAARGGRKSKGYRYAGSDDIDAVAWHEDNARGTTHPVGEKLANELGIYDMSGNVDEWCADGTFRQYTAADAIDPVGRVMGTTRALRGGSSYDYPQYCRPACRHFLAPESCLSDVGFRVVWLPA